MMLGKLAECLAVYIIHHDAVVGLRQVANQVRVVERIARLKLLLQGGHILRMGAQLGLQPFQAMQLAI